MYKDPKPKSLHVKACVFLLRVLGSGLCFLPSNFLGVVSPAHLQSEVCERSYSLIYGFLLISLSSGLRLVYRRCSCMSRSFRERYHIRRSMPEAGPSSGLPSVAVRLKFFAGSSKQLSRDELRELLHVAEICKLYLKERAVELLQNNAGQPCLFQYSCDEAMGSRAHVSFSCDFREHSLGILASECSCSR